MVKWFRLHCLSLCPLSIYWYFLCFSRPLQQSNASRREQCWFVLSAFTNADMHWFTLTCLAYSGNKFSEWVQKICSGGNQFRGIQMKLGQGDLGDGDCYLMQILVYLCRTHFLPSRYHCVPMKCAGFTRNQASSGSRSMATTPSLSRTRIVSSGRKEAVQTNMKSQWREGSMKLTCWIESVNPSTG